MYLKIAKVDHATGENFVRAKSPSVCLISNDTILNLLAIDLIALHLTDYIECHSKIYAF